MDNCILIVKGKVEYKDNYRGYIRYIVNFGYNNYDIVTKNDLYKIGDIIEFGLYPSKNGLFFRKVEKEA